MKAENESLKSTVAAQEEKISQLTKQARTKIMNVTASLKKIEEELERHKQTADNYKQKAETVETATRGKVCFCFFNTVILRMSVFFLVGPGVKHYKIEAKNNCQ